MCALNIVGNAANDYFHYGRAICSRRHVEELLRRALELKLFVADEITNSNNEQTALACKKRKCDDGYVESNAVWYLKF